MMNFIYCVNSGKCLDFTTVFIYTSIKVKSNKGKRENSFIFPFVQ